MLGSGFCLNVMLIQPVLGPAAGDFPFRAISFPISPGHSPPPHVRTSRTGQRSDPPPSLLPHHVTTRALMACRRLQDHVTIDSHRACCYQRLLPIDRALISIRSIARPQISRIWVRHMRGWGGVFAADHARGIINSPCLQSSSPPALTRLCH